MLTDDSSPGIKVKIEEDSCLPSASVSSSEEISISSTVTSQAVPIELLIDQITSSSLMNCNVTSTTDDSDSDASSEEISLIIHNYHYNLEKKENEDQYNNLSTPSQNLLEDIFESLIDDIIQGIGYHFFLRIKNQQRPPVENGNSIENDTPSNADIFGHSINWVRRLECLCPRCGRSLAAIRLAPHLEKCIGTGRNSSRLASKRIALFIKNESNYLD